MGNLDALEGAMYFLETGKYIVENQQVPPTSWNGQKPNKAIKISPIIGGGADQGLQDIKDLKEMVDLGCAFVDEPSATASAIWDGISGMTLEDAKNTLLGDWVQRVENYEKGNPYDWYQAGRDGVGAVKYIYAGGLTTLKTGITNAGSSATTLANRGWRVASRAPLRNAIVGSTKSLEIAKQYFAKIRNNPLDYPIDMRVGSLSEQDWINQKFLITNNFQGHHVIPKQALESKNLRKILDWAESNGKLGEFDFGTESNGIMLSRRKSNGVDVVGDHANHPQYNRQIINLLESNATYFPRGDPSEGFKNLKLLAAKLKDDLQLNVVNGSNIVNDLTVIFP